MTKQVILCIDDERNVLDSLKIELLDVLDRNYLIEVAEGGEEAIELVEELLEDDYEILLVISDYIMPNLKGDEVLIRIHQISPKTLTVMLTGQSVIEGVANAINYANLYRFISKPWNPHDMQLTVKEAINSYFQQKKLEEQNAQLMKINQELELALEAQSRLIQAARRFVPNEFVSLLGYQSLVEVELGNNVQKEMSILFADIRNFTSISESLTPQDNFNFINAYLKRMEPAIRENNGFIDKYMGDGIMALFGDSANDALKAAIAMQERINKYNHNRCKSGFAPITIGIGINTGLLMLGTVGGENRMDSTVISDAVNLASRLEGLTKFYGAKILIGGDTFTRLEEANQYNYRFLDRVKVKGKNRAVAVFEVFDGEEENLQNLKIQTRTKFEQAVLLYAQQEFTQARQKFQEILQINPQDRAAMLYISRCEKYQQYGVPQEWEGIEAIEDK
jgi:class 3 adenylate cyclase